MRRLAKNLILATVAVSAIFFVDLSSAQAVSLHEKNCPLVTDIIELRYMDFWGKFRDTVMPDPDTPQNNNPPKEMRKPPSHGKKKPEAPPPPPKNQSFITKSR